MKKFMQEFRTFATRGNVIDLAVGVIIGGAFQKIVTSFVNDLFMPLISILLGNMNLSNMKWVLKPAQGETAEIAVSYGLFIQTTINFILIAFIVFVMVRLINRYRRKEAEKPSAPPAPTKEELLLTEIRDLLKQRG